MSDEDIETLKCLFDFDPNPRVFRIRFDDGQEFELDAMNWWHDQDEPAHGTGIVVRTIRSQRIWKQGSGISFRLEEVEAVFDPVSHEILFEGK
jgi:hypothetical protein